MKKKKKKNQSLSPVPSSPRGEGGMRGKRILITRARDQSSVFAVRLKKLGAEVTEFPTIEILPPRSWKKLDEAMNRLRSYDWIVFTSVNGVHFFWRRLKEKGKNLSRLSSLKVAAIGPATAKKLQEKGVQVSYKPREFIAEGILRGFKKINLKGKRILLARAKKARDILPKGLREMGAEVDVVEVYRTAKPQGGSKGLKQLLTGGKFDLITFTSSSTVDHFAELVKEDDLRKLLKGIIIASIGPITSQTAKKRGMRVQIQPKQYTIPGLTQAIVDYFSYHPFPHGRVFSTLSRESVSQWAEGENGTDKRIPKL